MKATQQGARTRPTVLALGTLLIAGPILARALAGTGTLDSDVVSATVKTTNFAIAH